MERGDLPGFMAPLWSPLGQEWVILAPCHFLEQLNALKSKHSSIQEVRGTGLMIGVQMDRAVGDILNAILAKGVICGPAGPDVGRFLPALIVTKEQVDHVVSVLDAVLGDV